jgi:hypothetical protein
MQSCFILVLVAVIGGSTSEKGLRPASAVLDTPRIGTAEIYQTQFFVASLTGACLSVPGIALSYIALIRSIGIRQADVVGGMSWETQNLLLGCAGDALLLLSPATAALGAYWTGNHFYPPGRRGSYWATAAGDCCGAVAGIGLSIAGLYALSLLNNNSGAGTLIALTPVLVAPQLGAVLGYHMSRRMSTPEQGYRPDRFDLPNISLKFDCAHGRRSPGFDVRLLNLKF